MVGKNEEGTRHLDNATASSEDIAVEMRKESERSNGEELSNDENAFGEMHEYAPGFLLIFVAEVLGTATLMFLGCMGCVVQMVPIPVLPYFPSISFGLAVLVAIQTVGHISSAHLNPQVTLAAYILGKIKASQIPVYVAAEFLGAILGLTLVQLVSPVEFQDNMCITVPKPVLTTYQALAVEVIITAILILVCAAVWDPRNRHNTDSISIRFGFIVACISMVAGPYTGASMNTARSFAPAIINNQWETHWIYWVGPTVGSLIGATVYKLVLAAPRK